MELMNRITASLAITVVILLMVLSTPIYLHSQEKPASIEAYFSPNGECTESIIGELKRAKNTILVQAYSFTSAPIAKALLNAHKREVKVEVILDKSQRTQKYSSTTFLYNAGIPVKIDGGLVNKKIKTQKDFPPLICLPLHSCANLVYSLGINF